MRMLLTNICLFIGLFHAAHSQHHPAGLGKTVQYDFFNKPPLGQVQISPPQSTQFTPVTVTAPASASPFLPDNANPVLGNNPVEEQNRRLLQQHNMLPGQPAYTGQKAALAEVEEDLREEKLYRDHLAWLRETAIYRQTFKALDRFNPDSFSITQVVFMVENAFLENKLSYERFVQGLRLRAGLVKQILKREKLDIQNNVALNYGIQKLYSQPNNYYNPVTRQTVTVPNLRYDFANWSGDNDYTNLFVTKVLATGKGQCHSMPLLYLMIAEQVGAKAWLSLAPQHSFIRFADLNGQLANFETTNGQLVSSNWLLQSGYITANALKEKTYMDTLSQRQLYAQCLADLLLGYLQKFGYDQFAEKVRQRILQVSPGNMTAIIVDANVKTQIALQKIQAAGRPKPVDLPKYPEAYQAYLAMHTAYEEVDALGYQDMPQEAYQRWLQSLEQEKHKQENKELQAKMRREVDALKKQHHSFNNKPIR